MAEIKFAKHQCFILEENKIRRITGIIAESGKKNFRIYFHTELSSGKKLKFDSEDDLLKYDNTLSDPIHKLTIRGITEDDSYEVGILFSGERFPDLSSISVGLFSEDKFWLNSLSSQLEEQIERTKMPEIVYKIRQSPRLMNSLFFLVPMTITLIFAVFDKSEPSASMRGLLDLAASANTTDQKLDFLMKAQVAQLTKGVRGSIDSNISFPVFSIQLILILILIFILILAVWYLLAKCYPPSVFAWGDSGERFKLLTERRKNIWNFVIITIISGFFINIISPTLTSLIGL